MIAITSFIVLLYTLLCDNINTSFIVIVYILLCDNINTSFRSILLAILCVITITIILCLSRLFVIFSLIIFDNYWHSLLCNYTHFNIIEWPSLTKHSMRIIAIDNMIEPWALQRHNNDFKSSNFNVSTLLRRTTLNRYESFNWQIR